MSLLHWSAGANRGAIILAGGDGVRLRDLTRFITGFETPKQFCPIIGERTLLDDTRHRVAKLLPLGRTAIVVNSLHRRFYEPLLADFPRRYLIEQPRNRETVPAIFYGLRRLAHLGPNATIAIFPSDHFVGNDDRFMNHVEAAMKAVEESAGRTILLGVAPKAPEPAYGWIEPAAGESRSNPRLFPVARFWEKPRPELAARLWRQGCLWNTFVIVARAGRLDQMIAEYVPRLTRTFEYVLASDSSRNLDRAFEEVYRSIPAIGFSDEILARCPSNLMVHRVDDVDWSDLGEPERVLHTLRTIGHEPGWVRPFLYERADGSYYAELRPHAG
jgi:mannose-1-phosphate guanylyltransferase